MERLNHHHLYVFWIFAKHLSFTKAAKELLIAQSAVTAQVKQLENALELTLVNRENPRRVTLTEEGHKVAEYADDIFTSGRELLQWATEGALSKNRTLKVGALSGLSRNFQYEFLEPLLYQADIKFEVTSGDQKKLLKLLGEHQLDVVLTSQNASADETFKLYSHVLKVSPLVMVQKKDSFLKSKKGNRNNPTAEQQQVFIPGKQFESKSELDAHLETVNNLKVLGEIDDTALLRTLAVRSGYLVIIPEMGILNEIQNTEVVLVKKLSNIKQKFYAITRQRREPNKDVRLLIEKMG